MSPVAPPRTVIESPTPKPAMAKTTEPSATRRTPRTSANAPTASTAAITASAIPARSGSNGGEPSTTTPARCSAEATTSVAATKPISPTTFMRAPATARSAAGALVLLADAREDEDLVVHREAEEEREHHQRQPEGDGARGRDPEDEVRAVPLLPEPRHHAERGREREQVEDEGLEREQDRAKR